ncbi:hypothetical protein MMC10_008400 [Thelotrema lepadinum]|nr:hypothetical protein [Thelotrema lepadinum]
MGKPPGSKNKKTLQRLNALDQCQLEQGEQLLDLHEEQQEQRQGEKHQQQRTKSNLAAQALQTMNDDFSTGFNEDEAFGSSREPLDAYFSDIDHISSADYLLPNVETDALDDIDFDTFDMTMRSSPTLAVDLSMPETSGNSFSASSSADHLHDSEDTLGLSVGPFSFVGKSTSCKGVAKQCFACQCLHRQSKKLLKLREVEQSKTPLKLDDLLACTKYATCGAEEIVQCMHCHGDTQVLSVTIMSFHTLLRLAKSLSHPPSTPCPDFEMKLGQYEVPSREAQLFKNLLLSQALDRILKVTDALLERTENVISSKSEEDLWDFERVDLQTLGSLARGLPQIFQDLRKRVPQPVSDK